MDRKWLRQNLPNCVRGDKFFYEKIARLNCWKNCLRRKLPVWIVDKNCSTLKLPCWRKKFSQVFKEYFWTKIVLDENYLKSLKIDLKRKFSYLERKYVLVITILFTLIVGENRFITKMFFTAFIWRKLLVKQCVLCCISVEIAFLRKRKNKVLYGFPGGNCLGKKECLSFTIFWEEIAMSKHVFFLFLTKIVLLKKMFFNVFQAKIVLLKKMSCSLFLVKMTCLKNVLLKKCLLLYFRRKLSC